MVENGCNSKNKASIHHIIVSSSLCNLFVAPSQHKQNPHSCRITHGSYCKPCTKTRFVPACGFIKRLLGIHWRVFRGVELNSNTLGVVTNLAEKAVTDDIKVPLTLRVVQL